MKRSQRVPLLISFACFAIVVSAGYAYTWSHPKQEAMTLAEIARRNQFPVDDYVLSDQIYEHWERNEFRPEEMKAYFRMLGGRPKTMPERVFRFRCVTFAHNLAKSPYRDQAISAVRQLLTDERSRSNPEIDYWRSHAYSALRRLGDPSWRVDVQNELRGSPSAKAKEEFQSLLSAPEITGRTHSG